MFAEELKGFIGLSPRSGVEAGSGLYVDSLPDISVSIIEDIIADEVSVNDKWEEIEHRAILKFRTLFVKEVNNCHKISDIAACECLILSNKLLLAHALWYLMGAEVMITRRASSRINVATIDRNKPKELRDYFESQFQKELSTAVSGIDIHSSECFPEEEPECRKTIETVYNLP